MRRARILQCKMSMKQGCGLDRFPMQDEHENGGQVGMLRPGAGAHAECREPESRANTGVPAVQPQDRICGLPTSGSLRVGRAHFGSTRVWKFEQDRARTDPCLRGEGNGVERVANDPPNPKIPGYGRGAGATVPAAPICHSVHGAGHRIVGGSRPRPRALERASDTVHFAARVRAVWADGVCPAGAYFGGPWVQSASQCMVSQSGSGVRANPAHPDHDWGTAQTRSARPARVSARGHGTSRRLGRRQGGVSHQRRRYGDAVAGSGLRQQDQRKLLVACTGGDAGAISVCGAGVSCRQWLGVHQPHGGQAAGQAAGGVHQIAAEPQSGQRPGGRQKRLGDPQVDRLWAHPHRARRSTAEVLRPVSESVPELSSAVRLRHRDRRSAGQAPAPISGRRLPDALRKTEVAAGGHAISQTRPELGEAGPHRRREERHRMGAPDAGRQSTPPPAMQVATPDTAYVLLRSPGAEGRGNAGPVESVENQTAVSHTFHRPLEISQQQRDSHISTAPACAGWKSGKPKPGFPLFHAVQAMMMTVLVSKPKTEERTSAAARPSHFSVSGLTGSPDFMLILRLENAHLKRSVKDLHVKRCYAHEGRRKVSSGKALRLCGAIVVALGTLYAFQIPFREFNGVEYRIGEIPRPVDWMEPTEWAFARLMYPPAAYARGFGFRYGSGRWTEGFSIWTQDYPRADRHFAQALRR